MSGHADNLQSSIRDLKTQARHVAVSSNQITDATNALGAAAQYIWSQTKGYAYISGQAVSGINHTLESRLDGVGDLSRSQHSTIVELLTQIQSTLDNKNTEAIPNLDDSASSSQGRRSRTDQNCTALTAAIERLDALASESTVGHDSETAQVMVTDLELILDILINEAVKKDTSVPITKRKRADEKTNPAVTTSDIKKMKGI